MARTTVEDCIKNCENHFEIVLGVISRAKRLSKGAISELPQDNDKVIVQSLREIAQGVHVVDLNAEIERNLAEDETLTSGQRTVEREATDDEQPSSAV